MNPTRTEKRFFFVIMAAAGVVLIALSTAAHKPYSFIDAGAGIPISLYALWKLRARKRQKGSFYSE